MTLEKCYSFGGTTDTSKEEREHQVEQLSSVIFSSPSLWVVELGGYGKSMFNCGVSVNGNIHFSQGPSAYVLCDYWSSSVPIAQRFWNSRLQH